MEDRNQALLLDIANRLGRIEGLQKSQHESYVSTFRRHDKALDTVKEENLACARSRSRLRGALAAGSAFFTVILAYLGWHGDVFH